MQSWGHCNLVKNNTRNTIKNLKRAFKNTFLKETKKLEISLMLIISNQIKKIITFLLDKAIIIVDKTNS